MAEVALPAVPAQTGGAAAEQPAAQQPPVRRMLSSQRPPPSPFEDVPAADLAARPPLPPGTVAVPSSADAAADAADRRSPRNMIKPSKSALKISGDGGAPAAVQQPPANRALSWADTHGKVRALGWLLYTCTLSLWSGRCHCADVVLPRHRLLLMLHAPLSVFGSVAGCPTAVEEN